MEQALPPRIKVPVATVTAEAYRAVFGRLGLLLELAWLPLLVLLAADLAMLLLREPALLGGTASASAGEHDAVAAADIMRAVLAVLCLNAFAVRWHHAVLFARPQAVPPGLFARAWGRFLAYTAVISLLGLAAYAAIAAASAPDGPAATSGSLPNEVSALVATAVLTAAATLWLAVIRCSLVFPAAAYGRPLGWGEAWRSMRGNTWRLIGASLLACLPVIMVVGFVLATILTAAGLGTPEDLLHPPPGLSLLGIVVEIVLDFVLVALSASILSGFYRYIILRGSQA